MHGTAWCTCGATTIRERRNERIKAGIFAELKQIARHRRGRLQISGWVAALPSWRNSSNASVMPSVS
jgi:hypothetical protein